MANSRRSGDSVGGSIRKAGQVGVLGALICHRQELGTHPNSSGL